jgi:hypothetical protein
MKSSLITERPLLVSPTLAATIGLEEAIMLQALSEISASNLEKETLGGDNPNAFTVTKDQIKTCFPFWKENEINRIKDSLVAMGVITIQKGQVESKLTIEINGPSAPKNAVSSVRKHSSKNSRAASIISSDWQPEENWIRLCRQHSIPEEFVRSLVPEFVNYWRDRGQSRFSWGNAFYKHVIREWREEQTRIGAKELSTTMSAEWEPSLDATEILENSGIVHSFIDDAIPEFVLYWRERGVSHGAWNTKFVEHVRRQWAKYSASFNLDDTPRVIADNWEPSADCYEILELAEIDEQFARSQIPEFVMYWKDSQQVKSSWNTVFLQYIKRSWARQLKQSQSTENHYAENQFINRTSEQKVKERFQQFADRSWAE